MLMPRPRYRQSRDVLQRVGDLLHLALAVQARARPGRGSGAGRRPGARRVLSSMVPRRSASRIASMYWSTSGAVKALVEATPISGPVCIEMISIRDAHGLRADRVDDAPEDGAFAAPFFHGGQRVGRLAGLADGQHDRVFVDDRVAVAELGGDVHLDRDAGDLLDQDFADHAGVGGRAAGRDDRSFDALCQFWRSG